MVGLLMRRKAHASTIVRTLITLESPLLPLSCGLPVGFNLSPPKGALVRVNL